MPEPAEAETPQAPDIVYGLAYSPAFERDGLCVAACQSGLRRSQDQGRTWQMALESLNLAETIPATAVALSPDFESDRCLMAGWPGGVLVSNDIGLSGQLASLPTPPPAISALAVSPAFGADGIAVAGTLEDGVFISEDCGRHWASWNFGLLDYHILCLALSPGLQRDHTAFAGTVSGLFRSTNGGRAWREVDFPAERAPVLSLAASPNLDADGRLYAGTEASGLFVSEDRGRSWKRIGAEAITEPVNAILLSPDYATDGVVLALLPEAIWISRDRGQAWQPWDAAGDLEAGATCVAAPLGLGPGAPLLVGLGDGRILRL